MIKQFLKTKTNDRKLDLAIVILRLEVMAFMLVHGFHKLMKLLEGGDIEFADPIGLGMGFTLFLAVLSEFVCSILIGIGLGTRLATLPLIATMSIAAFVAHADDPFGSKEKALLYLVIYLVLFLVGSGKYSLDQYLFNKRR
jgi:putative oxidoreductase